MHACMHTYIHIYMYVYIYIFIYIYVHIIIYTIYMYMIIYDMYFSIDCQLRKISVVCLDFFGMSSPFAAFAGPQTETDPIFLVLLSTIK
jgi:hypothetical protein